MNAQELRIGNYLYNPARGLQSYFDVRAEDIDIIFGGDSLAAPIPLTKEILLKAGFEKSISRPDMYWLNSISLYKEGESFSLATSTFVEITTVHQLQNLYFALTQTELVLTL